MLYLFAVKNTVSAFFFSIGNYSEAVNDAKNAIELQPSFLKAFIRGKISYLYRESQATQTLECCQTI